MTTPYTGVTSSSGVRQAYTTTTTTNAVPTGYTTNGYMTTGYDPVYTTTYGAPTTTYLGGQTTTTYTGPTQTYVSGPVTQTYVQQGYGGSVVTGGHQKVVAEQIPVESRIEYIPFEKKYIEYDRVERIQRVPFEREIVEYEEVVHTERIPIERTITDYYAVETQIEYIPKEIEQTIVEYEPIERTWERVQYLPVETQIVHYPEREKYVQGQGKYIAASSSTVQNTGVYTTGYTTGQYATGQYGAGQYTTTAYQAPVSYQTTTTTPVAYTTTSTAPVAYQTYQNTTTTAPVTYTTGAQQSYQTVQSSHISGSRVGQSFVSGAHGTGSNYVYTSGGPIETSTYTSAGYAQPLSNVGYTTADGTHLTSTGHIIGNYSSSSNIKNNQSYQTNV